MNITIDLFALLIMIFSGLIIGRYSKKASCYLWALSQVLLFSVAKNAVVRGDGSKLFVFFHFFAAVIFMFEALIRYPTWKNQPSKESK